MFPYKIHVAEISGFGPANNEIFLIWILAVPLLLIVSFSSKTHRLILLLMSIIIITVFINPEAWVARYAPQFYICFVLAAIGLIIHKNKLIKGLGYFLMTLLLVNTFIIGSYYFPAQLTYTRQIKESIEEISTSKNPQVRFGFLVSHRQRLKESGVGFIENMEFDSAGWKPLPFGYESTSYKLDNP